MSIVLNEYEYAENALAKRELGPRPVETLSRVAKYFYANGYAKPDIRNKLDLFLAQCDPNVSILSWSATLDKLTKTVDKYPLIRLQEVPISKGELKTIEGLRSSQAKRLAFTLLCIAKYRDLASQNNHHWVTTGDKDIMNMANINTSVKRQSGLYNQLFQEGLIKFSKKVDNLSVQVLFTDDTETEMSIHNFRNLGYQYMKYYGGDYYDCENCGLTVKTPVNKHAGRKRKYCPECAEALAIKGRVDSVMRYRERLTIAPTQSL